VRILHVRMNCNTSTLTIEQLAVKQRKALLDKASATALTKLREIFFNADLTEVCCCVVWGFTVRCVVSVWQCAVWSVFAVLCVV